MNQYITFHKILDYLQEWVDGSPIMNSFGYGNLVDFGKNISGTTSPNYPFLFAVPQAITYDENTTTYQLTLIFADILNTDVDNEKDCVSDMSLQARRFLSCGVVKLILICMIIWIVSYPQQPYHFLSV